MPAARTAPRMGLPAKIGLAVTSPTTTRSPRSRAVPQVLSPRRMTAKASRSSGRNPRLATIRSESDARS